MIKTATNVLALEPDHDLVQPTRYLVGYLETQKPPVLSVAPA